MGDLRMFPGAQPTVSAPFVVHEEVCPTCKMPLADTGHGWVRSYWPGFAEEFNIPAHTIHTEKCSRRYGFCYTPCPTCSGGIEAKRNAQLINALFKDSNIPAYAREWTFATFPGNADQKAAWAVKTRMADWLAGTFTKGGLYLVGGNGRCKTSLAISALHAWLRKGHSGVFIGTGDLFDKLKEAIAASKRNTDYQDRYEASQGAKLLRLVKSVELLILDDLGVECGSKYEIRELYLILEARRAHGLYTIFTSNCDASSLRQYWKSDNAQEGVFEDALRVIARLGEYTFVIPVNGRDQRSK